MCGRYTQVDKELMACHGQPTRVRLPVDGGEERVEDMFTLRNFVHAAINSRVMIKQMRRKPMMMAPGRPHGAEHMVFGRLLRCDVYIHTSAM